MLSKFAKKVFGIQLNNVKELIDEQDEKFQADILKKGLNFGIVNDKKCHFHAIPGDFGIFIFQFVFDMGRFNSVLGPFCVLYEYLI